MYVTLKFQELYQGGNKAVKQTAGPKTPDRVEDKVIVYKAFGAVRNHIKLIHVVTSRRGFSKGTVLCGGYQLWAWQFSWGLQTCIAKRSKVPNG